jgi:bacillithiol system protein YtxJ
MGWQRLEQIGQLKTIVEASFSRPQLIFKHSTRCSISAAAKHRLELELNALTKTMDVYLLDLIMHRDISQGVASDFGVQHESPQVIVVSKGRQVFNTSHYDIEPEQIMQLQSTGSVN